MLERRMSGASSGYRMQDTVKAALDGNVFTVSNTLKTLTESGELTERINDRVFLDAYCDMNVLHAACKSVSVPVITLLLRTPGVNLDATDGEGRTPLRILLEVGRKNPTLHADALIQVKELLIHGAVFGYSDWRGLPLDATSVEWAPDGSSKSCARCGASFSFLERRHHCRGCGLIMCEGCCPHTDGTRACAFCFQVTQLWKARVALNNNR